MRISGLIFNILFVLAFSVSSASSELACRSLFLTEATSSFAYPRSIRLLDPAKPHTIENVREYLIAKIGKEVVEQAQNEKVNFVVIKGAAKDPLSQLDITADNLLSMKEISNPFGAFNVAQVNFKDGTTTYVFSNVNGESRYIQVLSFLRLAKIPESRISVKGSLQSYHSVYMDTFKQIGSSPDLVVFGFSNTSFEVVVESLVSTRVPMAQLKVTNSSYANTKWQKPSFYEHELKNMGVQVLNFSNGKKVWFIDNEYGDRASVLMQAMQDFGVKNILLLGTAGSLNPKYTVGQMVSPSHYGLENGKTIPAKFTGDAPREGKHGHVDSPALETKAWLKEQIERGIDFVDVELQKASAVVRKNIKYDAFLIISDELNSKNPQDYTKWAESHRQQTKDTLRPILRDLLSEIGIKRSTEIDSYQVEYFKVQHNEGEAGL